MKRYTKLFAFICLFAIVFTASPALNSRKAKAMPVSEFLDIVGPMATADMQNTGILASLTMAQAILESGWGTSELAVNANALFGMKQGNWTGATYYYNGTNWRAYGSWQESVNDHGRHLSTQSRYANLVNETNYVTACYNVAADGYCSDAGYAESLIKLIENYNLTQFDVHASRTLDGHDPINLGDEFYANIRQRATGLYLTDRDYNIIAAEKTNGNDQFFRFERSANGAYTICNTESNFAFDVSGGNYENGTNIQSYAKNDSLAQKFYIYYINGNFYFKAAAGDFVFDIDAGSKNLQIYGNSTLADKEDSLENQARCFEIIIASLPDGTWSSDFGKSFTAYIRNAENGAFLTADGDKVYGADADFLPEQKWIITQNIYGGYEIKNEKTGKAIDIAAGAFEEGTSVQLYEPNQSKAQTFFFIKRDERVYIKPAHTPNVLDMDANTKELHIYHYGDEALQRDAQLFELVTENTYSNETPIDFGTDFYAYVIGLGCNNALTEGEEAPQAKAVTYQKNQLWHFEYDPAWNAYKITGESGKVMDVSGAGWWDGAAICMYESNDTAAQRFRFYPSGRGYSIKPACTSKILDIEIESNERLQIWGVDTGRDSTTFEIVKITHNGKAPLDLGAEFKSSIKNVSSSLFMNPNGDALMGSKTEFKWTFKRQSDGSYVIVNDANKKVIDVQGGETASGKPLQLWEENGTFAQKFFIYQGETGYILQPAKCHGAMSMSSASSIAVTDITSASQKAQNFALAGAVVPDTETIALKKDSAYSDDGKFITGVAELTTVSKLVSNFQNKNVQVYDASGAKVASNAKVCTGFTVSVASGDKRVIIIKGDIDGNGIVDVTDSLRMKHIILSGGNATDIALISADMDENGKIDTTDFLRLKKYFLEK